jgi:hypothetical protein
VPASVISVPVAGGLPVPAAVSVAGLSILLLGRALPAKLGQHSICNGGR